MSKQFSWMVGGPQGSGVNSTAENFAKALVRGGYWVFANNEYYSNIKGKHSYYRLNVSEEPVGSHVEHIDLLLALDEETLYGDLYHEYPQHEGHILRLRPGAGLIYDDSLKGVEERLADRSEDLHLFPLPYMKILDQALESVGKGGQASKYQIMKNTVALGATTGILGFDVEVVAEVVREQFAAKGSIAELNTNAVRYAAEYARENFGRFEERLPKISDNRDRIIVKGTQAVAMGKIRAGLGFQSYYPISPATDESEYLEQHMAKFDLTVLQTEDEVAAVDTAVMAAHGGVRSSTSTSGPGYALMPEGVGWAAITEAPGPVVFIYMRGGPSTGLPTRHEQGDLRFALHGGQGDIPKIVMASGDINECFYDAFEVFNWAERYQLPVLVLVDKFMASTFESVEPFDTSKLKIDRGKIWRSEEGDGEYLRHRFVEDGVSPRAIPGTPGGQFHTTSDEHEETGHITEGVGHRLTMVEKRFKKVQLADAEIPDEFKFRYRGPEKPELLLISWGSTKGAINDAITEVDPEGAKLGFLQVRMMEPFPVETVRKHIEAAGRTLCLECNYSGQLAGVIRQYTGIACDHLAVKYEGRPFSRDEVKVCIASARSGDGPARMIVSSGGIHEEGWGLAEHHRLLELRESSDRMSPPSVPLPPGYNR